VALPAQVTVDANSSETVTLTATPASHGPQPFTVQASAANGVQASVDGVAVGVGRSGVLAQIDPALAVTGPGATAVYTVTVSNVGDTADDYALTVDAPAGWATQLTLLGAPVTQISLPATLFNTVDLLLLVTPPVGTAPGTYPLSVMAQSLSQPDVSATAAAEAQVSQRGVSVAISPANQTVDPTTPANWNVTVTNVGSLADTFDLTHDLPSPHPRLRPGQHRDHRAGRRLSDPLFSRALSLLRRPEHRLRGRGQRQRGAEHAGSTACAC
jgi:hypothetical protein